MAKLLVTLPGLGDAVHELQREVITIGRAVDNEIQINHESVAPYHALLTRKDRQFRLKSLHSGNNSWMNGNAVTETALKGSCILRFGEVECVFREEIAQGKESPTQAADAEARQRIEALLRARDAAHEQNRELIKQRDRAQEAREILEEEFLAAKAEIDALNRKVSAAAEEKRASAAALEGASHSEEEISSLKLDRDVAQKAEQQTAAHLAESRAQVDELKAQLSAAAKALEEESARVLEAQKQGDTAGAELNTQRELTAQLAGDRDALAEKLGSVRKEIEVLTQERVELAAASEKANQQRAELDANLAEVKRQLQISQRDQSASHQQLTEALAEAERQMQAARAEEKIAQDSARESQETILRLREEIAGLVESAGVAERARAELEEKLKAAEQEIQALGARANDFSKASAELDAIRGELAREREASAATQQELERRLSESQRTAESSNKELSEQLAASHAQRADLDKSRAELTDQLELLQLENTAHQQARAELASKYASLEKEAIQSQDIQQKLLAQSAELKALCAASDSAEARIYELTGKLAEAEKQVAGLSRTSRPDHTQAREDSAQLAALRREAGELKKQREVLLETNARLAVEVEAARKNAGGVQPSLAADALPDAVSRPELTSWLKRAFNKKKAPAGGVRAAVFGNEPAGQSHRTLSTAAAENLEDAHAVSLDFLGGKQAARNAAAAQGKNPHSNGGTVALLETPGTFTEPSSAPVFCEPNPALLRPSVVQTIVEMRRTLQYFIRHTSDIDILHTLWRRSMHVTEVTERAGYPLLHMATTAFEALFCDLYKIPSRVNASTIRTLGQAIDFIYTLLEEPNLQRLVTAAPMQAIAIEDEPDVLEGIVAALEAVKLKTCATKHAKAAMALLSAQKFDLIFLDVGLPDMNGLELCSRIRGIAQHRKTPIVFLTGMTTVEHRAQSTLNGGNDFVGKPFYLSELSMKAATWVLKGHLGMV